MPWDTIDPFLFCVYHDDQYPKGNGQFGPEATLDGRALGQDFSRRDGWSMYHGQRVPGFPSHPHRGFETVTIVRRGVIDHSDSLGAAARYSAGDVQWLTAGSGIQHAEMFPLLDHDKANPLELFQIWLNLPARSKMAKPHFTMLWAESIPRLSVSDANGRLTELSCIAGTIALENATVNATENATAGSTEDVASGAATVSSPPDSWASQPESDLAIWTLAMEPGAHFALPTAQGKSTRRCLYFFKGAAVTVAGQRVESHAALELDASQELELVCGETRAEFLLLQGRPIGETVAQHGPFVMNTRQELVQAFEDYQRTQFGGWPWPDSAPVHGDERVRFARHHDGRLERMPFRR